jgi:arsenate reductase
MTEKMYNVLVLCTGNSARSIMAEALINTMGHGRFCAFSAGSMPGGVVNPFAVEQISATGYPLENLRSKSWDEFSAPGAPIMDFVITVCDNAAGEVCPFWPGHPFKAHWGFEDPAAFEGTDEEKRHIFHKVFTQIVNRVQLFVNLPLHVLEPTAIKQEIDKIGHAGSNYMS